MSIHRESELTGAGGLRLYWQSWLPDGEPNALVVIAHGGNEHSGRYGHVAAALVGQGYAVYAIDHRGHGRSEGQRGLLDRMDNVVADLDSLVVLAGAEHPGLPVFLLGHSMGGAIAVCYAMRHQPDDTRAAQSSEAGGRAGREHVRLTGLLLSGPLAALEAASPVQRVVANALSALAPRLPLIKIDASLVSRDPDVVDAYVNDPLVYRGRLRARTIGELSDAIGRFPEGVRAIRIPTLIMYGTADGLCPPAGSVMLSERIGADDKTLKAYDGLAHEIFNEPERQQVIDDMCAWLAAHVPIAPGLSSAAGG